mgnify:FL=1
MIHPFGHYPRKRELALATLAATLALVYGFGLGPKRHAAAMTAAQRAHIAERAAMHYAGTVAGCLSNGLIVWVDPHTSKQMGTYCYTRTLNRKAP